MRNTRNENNDWFLFSENMASDNMPTFYQYSLTRFHDICEKNYLMIAHLKLSLGESWSKKLPNNSVFDIQFFQKKKYTSFYLCSMTMSLSKILHFNYTINIKLYHDAMIAEVSELYVNNKMLRAYQMNKNTNEKFHINCLVYEWLHHVCKMQYFTG